MKLTRKERRSLRKEDNNALKAQKARNAKLKEVAVVAHTREDYDVKAHLRGGLKLYHDVYGLGRVKEEDYEKGGFIPFYPSTLAGRKNGSVFFVSARLLEENAPF